MWPNPQETADFVTFTVEIINGDLHFCAVHSKRTLDKICLTGSKNYMKNRWAYYWPDWKYVDKDLIGNSEVLRNSLIDWGTASCGSSNIEQSRSIQSRSIYSLSMVTNDFCKWWFMIDLYWYTSGFSLILFHFFYKNWSLWKCSDIVVSALI